MTVSSTCNAVAALAFSPLPAPRSTMLRMQADEDAKVVKQAALDKKLDAIYTYAPGTSEAHLLERNSLLGNIDSSELLDRDPQHRAQRRWTFATVCSGASGSSRWRAEWARGKRFF